MLNSFILFLKGIAMGSANVIPGVSGGTIALITNIYEQLINSLKSFDKTALKLALKRDFKSLSKHLNLDFLLPVFSGIIISIISLAKLFEFLLSKHPEPTWAFFFGLVLASVYYVAKKVNSWKLSSIVAFAIGLLFAFSLSVIEGSTIENTNLFYIFVCGMIGICGMILPGLSGSYILMLMGNYQLLMVKSISNLFDFLNQCLIGNFNIIFENTEMRNYLIYFIVFVIGSIVGLLLFSKIISFIFKKYYNVTIALMSGFVLGSLSTIWPWKKAILDTAIKDRHGDFIIVGYQRYVPQTWTDHEYIVLTSMFVGLISIIIIEQIAKRFNK